MKWLGRKQQVEYLNAVVVITAALVMLRILCRNHFSRHVLSVILASCKTTVKHIKSFTARAFIMYHLSVLVISCGPPAPQLMTREMTSGYNGQMIYN